MHQPFARGTGQPTKKHFFIATQHSRDVVCYDI
jgi:hypothetical protein